MTKLKVAMIGLGMAAGHHARALLDLSDRIECVAAFSPTATRREAFAAEYPIPVTDDLDAIFADKAIEAVLILTPPSSHLELVQRCATAKKHILLEKPLDISFERSEAIVKAARDAGVLLAMVLQNRFRTAALKLDEIVKSERLGQLIEASVAIRNWRPQSYYDVEGRGTMARDGGGVLLTQGIHTIDLLLSFAGTPKDVSAFVRTSPIHSMETEDLVTATFAYENGAIGTLNATTCAYPGLPERIELLGTKGTAVFTGDTLTAAFMDGTGVIEAGEKSGSGAGANPMAFGHEMHRALIENFVDAVRNGAPLRVTGEDALKAHRFISEILAASR
ncbi:Gfo/Idh/MocA family protein [Neorhizobium galegae]|uniref:Gfo/Idh/MocA family protein n=1 Tax=Neorhizobium galegae TaxID=399 RepID=UPI000621B4F3|nr:Gfo/Idh/MocA family oxidoreductase [Neorhizobium galegae]CDZ28744.1 Lipopolysaccharide biosynthesis protein BplA [Neorhizobium galegae bv. officinalis]KAA9386167.1 Gfo/Idh/MocA family oxidoreductase [Neorhizobium galegae]KAB1113390.1 Gfo/Idh/MocA family oxidoreductase [Neorhizobium galegae]MCM2496344.1 Gfo/Idh/MocA family oxidoreductase [Neorhizobium galegae]MCQ1770520.1 Gfo/Idh/MocA family oxidoreductase [Neorhizobium galegae]